MNTRPEKDINKFNPPGDPTPLTIQMVWREIASLKELVFERLAGIEKAIEVAHEDLVRVPTNVQKEVGALKELLVVKLSDEHNLKEEKFNKVYQRFELIETARIEQKNDTRQAVLDAFASSKEAIAKSETNFIKQIDQQNEKLDTINVTLSDKINDNKDRLVRIESIATGVIAGKTEHLGDVSERRNSSMSTASMVSITVGILFGLVGAIMTVLAYINK